MAQKKRPSKYEKIRKFRWSKKGFAATSNETKKLTKQHHEPIIPYIGRVPVPWIAEAGKLPGRTVVVALAILYVYGMKPNQNAVLTRYHFNEFSVSRGIVLRGMEALQEAGLIKYTKSGNSYVVTVLTAKPESATKTGQ